MVLTYPTTGRMVGSALSSVQVHMLRTVVNTDPYVACVHTHENIRRLVLALHSPSTTAYARYEPSLGDGEPGVAVSFASLREEMFFALPDCVYLFDSLELPAQLNCLFRPYTVSPFVPRSSAVGSLFKVPIHFAPPWEALPPAYVCCLSHNREHLKQVLLPGATLEDATLLVDDRLPVYRHYVAAAISNLQFGVRERIERMHQTHRAFFSCLYDPALETHPLFLASAKWYERCQLSPLM